jgi:hypothetical protein
MVHVLSCTTGFTSSNAGQLIIGPNPSCGMLFIATPPGYTSAQIFNLAGQTMLEIKLISNKNNLDISGLPEGIYQLCFYMNDKLVVSQKLIRQN